MLKNSVAILGLSLITAVASAQQQSVLSQDEVRLLPEYVECTVDGVRYACYTEESQQLLNLLETNALSWHRKWRISENLRVELTNSINNMTTRLGELSTIDDLQRTRIDTLMVQLNREIELKNQYRMEAEDTDLLPLYIGAVVGILGVGLAAGVLLVNWVN